MKEALTLALEAGVEVTYDPTETPLRAFAECWIEDLERFAELVRADEREACAAQLDFNAQASSNGGDEYLAALLWQEAEEIRARGNT